MHTSKHSWEKARESVRVTAADEVWVICSQPRSLLKTKKQLKTKMCVSTTERIVSDCYSWILFYFIDYSVFFFFCISFILYSGRTVHYTNVQGGKILLLHYTSFS